MKRLLMWLAKRHCVKSVRIRSYSAAYSVRMRVNTDQNNSECGHFLRSDDCDIRNAKMYAKISLNCEFSSNPQKLGWPL